MMGNWNFFVPSENPKEQKVEKEKVPNKFLGWMSSLLKRKKEPLSLNLEGSKEAERIKQEIAAIPEEDRRATESFLAEEIAKIEQKRESFHPELGEEVVFRGESNWFVSDSKNGGELLEIRRSRKNPKGSDIVERNIVRREELSLPLADPVSTSSEDTESEFGPEIELSESMENKFKPEDKVMLNGESGWKVESVADGKVDVGRIRKDPRGKDVYETKIVSEDEIEIDAQSEPELKVGEEISVNGDSGWQIVSIPAGDGKYLEVGKLRADKKGTLIFERKIVEAKEIKKEK